MPILVTLIFAVILIKKIFLYVLIIRKPANLNEKVRLHLMPESMLKEKK